jgi:hypothetical protein
MHVDVTRATDGTGTDTGPGQRGRQPGPAAGPEHQLGGVFRPGEGEQGLGDVVADHLVVRAAQSLGKPALGGQRRRVSTGQPVGAGDVDG